jgi:hypothetical protein
VLVPALFLVAMALVARDPVPASSAGPLDRPLAPAIGGTGDDALAVVGSKPTPGSLSEYQVLDGPYVAALAALVALAALACAILGHAPQAAAALRRRCEGHLLRAPPGLSAA